MEETQGAAIERQFGKYRLIAELGRGGMANVYLAVSQGPAGFNKLVVIKFLKQDLASDSSFVEMFISEARLAARLNHPNVVQTNEVGAEENRPYIAMEFLDGQPLNRVQHRGRQESGPPLPLSLQLRILCEMLLGLHHAHELTDYDGTPLGVVHRDITPHNIFVTYEGQVKVVDFGIAKVLNSTNHTQTGVLKGKVAYMAPEQVRGETIDRRADLFTVGILLWEAIVGHRMWKGLVDVVILKRMVLGEMPDILEEKPDVDPALLAIVQKALALAPEARYQTALELRADLEGYLRRTSDNPDAHSIASWMKQAFAEDRDRLKNIIETQISKVRSMPTSELMAAALPIVDLGSTMPISSSFSQGTPSGTHSSALIQGPNSVSVVSTALSATPANLVPPPSSSRLPILALVGLLAAAAGVAVLLRPKADPPPAPAATAAAAREAEVLLTALPHEAQLFWDDRLLPGNPYKGRFPLDGKTHQLVVRAPGYVERQQTIDLTTASEVTLRLERQPEPAATAEPPTTSAKVEPRPTRPVRPGAPRVEPPAATPAATPTATTPPPDQTGPKPDGKKPRRTIDKDVPYP